MSKTLDESDINRVKRMFLADQFMGALNIRILEIDYARAAVSVTVTETMLNGAGVANGGVVFTLADVALAIAANTLYESVTLTLNMSVNYIKGVSCGDVITAVSACVPGTGKMIAGSVEVTNQRAEVVATAQGLSFVTKKQQEP